MRELNKLSTAFDSEGNEIFVRPRSNLHLSGRPRPIGGTSLVPKDFSDPSRGLVSTVYEQPGYFEASTAESTFDYSGAANIFANVSDVITTTLINNDLNSNASNIINSMPRDYSFQYTDIANRQQAISSVISDNKASLDIFNSARMGLDSFASLFGPEVGVPVALTDAVFGNLLAGAFFDPKLDDVPYAKVTTYGDFGSAINSDSSYVNNQPTDLTTSVLNYNG